MVANLIIENVSRSKS